MRPTKMQLVTQAKIDGIMVGTLVAAIILLVVVVV
jgi:hypothetical protein